MNLTDLPMIADARMGAALLGVIVLLWLATAGWAALAFRRARHTTMAAPAAWCVASALTMAAVTAYREWADVLDGSLSASVWRYAAAVSTCCPLMAVLGAKRPQDRGWQWIVVSLWIILLVPAGQAVAAASGEIELLVVWRLMLGGLIAMGLLNYLPTRYAVPAILVAIAQVLLLNDYLFEEFREPEGKFGASVGPPVLLLLACAVAEIRRADCASELIDDQSIRWRDFRNRWGAFWALRVMQRVNQTAEAGSWPVRLEWSGFEPNAPSAANDECDAMTIAKVDQALNSLLWRFERPESE